MATIVIGQHSLSASSDPFFTTFLPEEVIMIGKFSGIAAGAKIYSGLEHHAKNVAGYPLNILYFNMENITKDVASIMSEKAYSVMRKDVYNRGPTIIGNDVLIMYNAIVLSGVKIGDGAFVGAGAVVRKDVPPYAIVMGNPARIAGYRFSEEQIKSLLRIRWWDWSHEELKRFEEYFQDVDTFIPKALEKMKKEGRL